MSGADSPVGEKRRYVSVHVWLLLFAIILATVPLYMIGLALFKYTVQIQMCLASAGWTP